MKERELLQWSLNSPISYVLSHPHSENHDYITSEHVAREHVAREKGVSPNPYIYVLSGFAATTKGTIRLCGANDAIDMKYGLGDEPLCSRMGNLW